MALAVGDALLPAEMTVRGMSYIEQLQEVRRHGILTNDRPAPRRILRNTNFIFNDAPQLSAIPDQRQNAATPDRPAVHKLQWNNRPSCSTDSFKSPFILTVSTR